MVTFKLDINNINGKRADVTVIKTDGEVETRILYTGVLVDTKENRELFLATIKKEEQKAEKQLLIEVKANLDTDVIEPLNKTYKV